MKKLFWLHIKKSAGQSTRKALKPHYIEVDRSKPQSFIQSKEYEYNDILNNYRTPLGDYQFKRSLFAKNFLFKEEWDSIFSFAFSREPIDRCLSMFYYLFWSGLKSRFYSSLKSRKILLNDSYAFDYFLELIMKNQNINSYPENMHFTTHTNPMWNDITDNNDNILLSKVFRLENFREGIDYALTMIDKKSSNRDLTKVNSNQRRGSFNPSISQIKKIQKIYKKDFDLYESINF
mgnify:CR=1 FL=1